MAIEPAGQRVSAEEPFSHGRKGAQVTRSAFGVKREVFAVGELSGQARRFLRKRLGSELDAVRDLIRKGESLSLGAGPAGNTGSAVPVEDSRFLAAGPLPEVAIEADESRAPAAKRIKVSLLVEQAEEPKRVTPDERERLAARLISLAAVLPDHVVAFLQSERAEAADSRGDGGEIEMDMQSMKDGALFQLKVLLDKFAPEITPKNPGRAALDASGVSCLLHHRNAGDKIAPVEEDESVNVCGGASPVAIRDIAEEYGELVDDIGIQPLSPLQRKYVDLAEQDEFVDICGDASPVVFPAKASEISSSPSSSSSGSGASSSDSGSSSSSDSDADQSVNSPLPSPVVPNVDGTTSQPLVPASEAVQIAGQEELQDKRAAGTPPPEAVQIAEQEDLQDKRAAGAPSPEALQIAEFQELQDQRVACAPSPEDDTPVQPSAPASVPEMVQRAEPEELQDQCAAPAPMVPPITSTPPAPAALPMENDNYAQPPEPAPEAVQIAEPEELQDQDAAPPTTNLIARAQEALERRRQEEKKRMRKKARRELLEVERAAVPDERIYPPDMELLGIATFEHVVSSVEDAPTAGSKVNGGGLVIAPDGPSILRQLGLFLKDDDAGDEREGQVGVAPGGADMDMEEGEIR